ncbi:MAG: thiamine pyrophosphate-dependent enzyme [Candidatus Buchananbacteria bacterium]|nr:thiamine pyrophosphate-dependent enzyme [Candidatus Buchananbacteria bacterium]
MSNKLIKLLKERAWWVRKETIKIHGISPDTRLASSLSDVEIFTALYYGKILKYSPKDSQWEKRDRFIISKPHGAISLYPILADLGFLNKRELKRVGENGSLLGGIPDTTIPGFETINGALGHGLGVACGMALALKKKKSKSKVFVLSGDGELFEGAVWEAIMFASHHKLNNLILIVDNNKISMLDYCKNTIDLIPLEKKFQTFKWQVRTADGHNIQEVYDSLRELKEEGGDYPKVLIANTVKGKGVPQLENDALCHIRSLKQGEVINAIKNLGKV